MIEIFRYFKGFVRISVTGDMSARFLGECLKEGITVWNILKADSSIFFSVYMCDYKRIRAIRQNFSDPIKIKRVKKTGFYSVVRYHRRRPGILVGVLLFVIINFFLSQYIWDIDVKGAETIDKNEIFKVCSELDITTGVKRNSIDTYNAKQIIATKVEGIAWVSLNVEGTRLTVNISEARENKPVKNDLPCNLVAKCDGVIKKIEVIKGKKNIVIDQAVRKGDLLVSGVVENNENQHFVTSQGSVTALTEKVYNKKINKLITLKYPGNLTDCRKVIEFFWLKMPLYLSDVDYEHHAFTIRHGLNFMADELPIALYKRYFFRMIRKKIEVDEEIAKRLALNSIYEEIKEQNILSVEECEISVKATSQGFDVNVRLSCLENIAQIQEIPIVNN